MSEPSLNSSLLAEFGSSTRVRSTAWSKHNVFYGRLLPPFRKSSPWPNPNWQPEASYLVSFGG